MRAESDLGGDIPWLEAPDPAIRATRLTTPGTCGAFMDRDMTWKTQTAAFLLGLAVLNPLCCCLADVFGSPHGPPMDVGAGCCQTEAPAHCPEDTPAQEPPCECEESVTQHKEAWPQERLLDELAAVLPRVLGELSFARSPGPLAGDLAACRHPGSPPVWQLHCVRLL